MNEKSKVTKVTFRLESKSLLPSHHQVPLPPNNQYEWMKEWMNECTHTLFFAYNIFLMKKINYTHFLIKKEEEGKRKGEGGGGENNI